MRQDDASSGRNPQPPGNRPGDGGPADEGTIIMGPLAAPEDSPTMIGEPPGGPVGTLCPNPSCRQPLGPETRFCQACGTEILAAGAVEEEKPRPWFVGAMVIWLLLAAAAFLFLYANAFIGRR